MHSIIRYGGHQSNYEPANYDVPHGLVLGPLMFIIYTAEHCSMGTAHQLHPQRRTGWRPPTESNTLRDQLSSCVQDICRWMSSHPLQLNTSKTELIWCCPLRRCLHIPEVDFDIDVNQFLLLAILASFVDGKLSMRFHTFHVTASCLSAMSQIRSIWRSLLYAALQVLITSLVHSWLDYCTSYSRDGLRSTSDDTTAISLRFVSFIRYRHVKVQ